MKPATSELIFNILRYSFPQSHESKLARLAERLQWRPGAGKQTWLDAQKGEWDMKIRLLFVDDNLDLVKSAGRYITEIRPHWRFLAAHSLAQARQLYDQYVPHAAVLDVGLPDGSGLDLLSELKSRSPDLAVIVISGDDPVTISQAVIERKGNLFLPKPFSTAVLVSHIESAIAPLLGEAANQEEPLRDSERAEKTSPAPAFQAEGQKLEDPEPEGERSNRLFLK